MLNPQNSVQKNIFVSMTNLSISPPYIRMQYTGSVSSVYVLVTSKYPLNDDGEVSISSVKIQKQDPIFLTLMLT